MTGSPTPDSDTDQQCPHCGLYYSNRGIISHRRNCEFQQWPGALHPEAEAAPEEPEGPRDRVGATPDVSDGDPSSDRETPQPDGVGGEGIPPSDDGGAPEPVETDGGPRAPPEPALEDDDPVGDDDQEAAAEPTCPKCDSEDWFDPGGLDDDVLEELPDEVEAANRACWDCSTDEEGALAESIVVYDT